MKIKKIKVCLEDQVVMSPIEIESDIISSFNDNDGLDLSNCYLIPGLIDQHIHGSASFDVMDGSVNGLEEMSKSLLEEGTTSFLGTTMTESLDNINKAIESVCRFKNVQTQGARILGINLEGPYLSKEKCGAQRADALVRPSIEFVNSLNHLDLIKMVTIAPELPGALEVIKYLTDRKIIASIGHTNATYEEVVKGIKSGAHQITHGFNAMSEFNHHGVNAAGAMLLEDSLKVELICDGIHVSKEAIKLLYKLKGRENIILITDS